MAKSKPDTEQRIAELVKTKRAAGLSRDHAEQVAKAQVEHEDALAVAAEEAPAPKKDTKTEK